ncbi:hypothetical protein POSPLADRAFT_1040301, partial [Postia placenta MAD-698-R-SB12]
MHSLCRLSPRERAGLAHWTPALFFPRISSRLSFSLHFEDVATFPERCQGEDWK